MINFLINKARSVYRWINNGLSRLAQSVARMGAVALAFLGVGVVTGVAHAASILPSDINTTFGDAKADMVTVIGLGITLLLVIVGWRFIKRVF